MKRIAVIVEGQTEAEFVKNILAPHLHKQNIYCVYPILIQTSTGHKGGFVNYSHLKRDILCQLRSKDEELKVTTFVDFFRCPQNIPGFADYMEDKSHSQIVEHLEKSIQQDIGDKRFIPYIQLHEFEALLFSSDKGFEMYFSQAEHEKTLNIINKYPNPEEINSIPEGAPSKRLLAIRPNYNKVIEGTLCALENGIEAIIEKCPRFRMWTEMLIK